MKRQKIKKLAGVLLLSAVMIFSATTVTANTRITTNYSIEKMNQNLPLNPGTSLNRFDDIIWDMIQDEVWDEFIYRELTFDLNAYSGEVIQIAWRYVGIDGNSFGLDDITITADASDIIVEGFEAGVMPPEGWSVINTHPTRNWVIVDVVTYPDFIHSGTYAGWVNYDTPIASDEWLITPEIDLTSSTSASVTFWAESNTKWPTATVELHIMGSGGSDTTPPVTTCTLEGDMQEEVYISDVTVTLTATDDDSGVNYTMYQVDSGTWKDYSVPFVVSGNGEHTVTFYSVDAVGNKEDDKTATFTIQYPIEIIISGGLGVKAIIKNTGTADLTNVNWSITLDGSTIFVGKSKSGTIASLPVGESETVKDFVIGFGKTGIAVEADGMAASAQGTALLFFVIGVA